MFIPLPSLFFCFFLNSATRTPDIGIMFKKSTDTLATWKQNRYNVTKKLTVILGPWNLPFPPIFSCLIGSTIHLKTILQINWEWKQPLLQTSKIWHYLHVDRHHRHLWSSVLCELIHSKSLELRTWRPKFDLYLIS